MEKDIVAEAKDEFTACEEAEQDNRAQALDDLKFGKLGEQWDETIVNGVRKGRPCLTINKLPAFLRQVINETRQNKPSIKVHPVDSGADVETANVIGELIRNIEYTSNADVAYDTGADFAASMGFGYWRVGIDYACDDSFDKDLKIERVANPFTIYGDPYSTDADSADWDTSFVTEVLKASEFKKRYPDADKSNWESSNEEDAWFGKDAVRIAERWKRERIKKNLLKLSDGTVLYEDDFVKVSDDTGFSLKDLAATSGIQVVGSRVTESYRVRQWLMTGSQILPQADGEDVMDWVGRYIPIIPVYGEEVNVEGKRHFLSLIRQAKDAQKNFNYWRSAATELVALAPKAPYIGPKGAFRTDANKWNTANVENHPYIEYDGSMPPQRQPFAGVPAGALQEALNSSDDMKAIMGMYDASLGARSNETSGKAIMARQREGDVSTFHFVDNVTRAIRHTGRILIDLIPHVYSEARVLRVMGEDGTPRAVQVNQNFPKMDPKGQPMMQPGVDPAGQPANVPVMAIHNLTTGKYDLTVSSGPSYTTRRQEAADQMVEMGRAVPRLFDVAGDLMAKNFDWPGADKLAERLEKAMPGNQPPPDPMKSPDMMKAQAELQIKKESSDHDMQIEDKKLAMKEREAALDAQIKISEHQMEMQQMREKNALELAHMQSAAQFKEFKQVAQLGAQV